MIGKAATIFQPEGPGELISVLEMAVLPFQPPATIRVWAMQSTNRNNQKHQNLLNKAASVPGSFLMK